MGDIILESSITLAEKSNRQVVQASRCNPFNGPISVRQRNHTFNIKCQ